MMPELLKIVAFFVVMVYMVGELLLFIWFDRHFEKKKRCYKRRPFRYFGKVYGTQFSNSNSWNNYIISFQIDHEGKQNRQS